MAFPHEVTQFFNDEDFSEIFKGRIRGNYAGCSQSSSSKAAASEDPEAYSLGYVEDLNDARTTHGKRRAEARQGRAGEKSDFFSIPLQQIADQFHRLFGRGSGMDEMRREVFEQAHPGFVGSQQYHGLLCLQR